MKFFFCPLKINFLIAVIQTDASTLLMTYISHNPAVIIETS